METDHRRRTLWALLAAPLGVMAAGAAAADTKARSAEARLAELEAKVDEQGARQAIAELLYAYARANDRFDETLLRSCFWPESTHKHGAFDGKSSDFVAFAAKIVAPLKYTAHHITNVTVEVKGDQAFSECYYFAHHRRPAKDGGAEEDAFFQGRYLDRHERRAGVWKIIQRRGLSDYSIAIPASKPFADWPADQRSGRFPEDDFYRMLQKFRGA